MSIPGTFLATPIISRFLPIRSPRTNKENDPEGVAFEYEVLE
jgi:hypothetical protein